MVKILLKKQLTEIFRAYFYDAKKNKARSKAAITGYIVLFVILMVGILGGMFTFLSVSLCGALTAVGFDWLYFAIMSLLAILLGAFGSVFNTYSGLYLAKDNDLLLSMPIPVGTIMISRLLGVYLMGLMYSGVVLIPAAAVYLIIASHSLPAVIGCILLVLLISVFVLTVSSALGWVVAKISLKLKNKSFITVIVSLLFFGAYYFVCFKAQDIISDLIVNAAKYGDKIKGSAYPIYLFGRVGTGDFMAILIVSAVVLLLFALMWALISRSFLKTAKKKYRETVARKKSVQSALLHKEFARFVSSPNYMLNCGLGILLLPVLGIALLIKGNTLMLVMNELFGKNSGSAAVLLFTAVCAVASMNDTAAPSISLEGKSLWTLQSLPVRPLDVLRAKLNMQLILTGAPVIICMLCAAFMFTPLQFVSAFVSALTFVLLLALFDLFVGLKMPNLNWTSEITPIKQSGGVMIAMLGGFIYTVIYCALFFMVGYKLGAVQFLLAVAAINLILSVLIYLWLKKKGTAVFSAL
jgi:ABC-2 type transport system permease protein